MMRALMIDVPQFAVVIALAALHLLLIAAQYLALRGGYHARLQVQRSEIAYWTCRWSDGAANHRAVPMPYAS